MILSAPSTLVASAALAPHVGSPWAGGFFPFFFLIPILWLLVAGGVVFLIVRGRRRAYWRESAPYGPWAPAARAEATLAERFAQGDIDEVEYRRRLEVLRANRPGPEPR